MHRAGQMVVEPHAPEAGPLGRGGAGQDVVDADTERVQEQVDLHQASMAEPTGWTDPAPSDWWHPAVHRRSIIGLSRPGGSGVGRVSPP
jgi:hypothetical protein